MAVKIKCSLCETKFLWDFAALGWPENCPKCKKFIGVTRADDDICMPSIKSMRTKVIDSTYTQMEKGSEFRAQAAAEMTGAPVSEMSGLKITDMKDGMREGDIAVREVRNEVTQHMDAMNARGGQFGFQQANGVGHSGAVQTGAFANSGAKFQTVLRQQHGERTNYQAVGDAPALEVLQPGYRRRA
jgi:Cu/Zn superoxide dismutase